MINFTQNVTAKLSSLSGYLYYGGIALSLIPLFVGLYYLVKHFINKSETSTERKHKTLVSAKKILTLTFKIFLVFFLVGELRTSVLSAAAVFSAFVIIFREVILSFIISVVNARSFKMGDYVEVEGHIGKIINQTFVTTTILINNTYQTQEVILPNIIFWGAKVKKISKIKNLQFHSFTVAVEKLEDVQKHAHTLAKITQQIIEDLNPTIMDYMRSLERYTPYFNTPDPLVTISYDLSDIKKISFTINYIARPAEINKIKNAALEQYFSSELFQNLQNSA